MNKVCVGISGGVDSAVSALLLKNKGYDVTGVFIRGWQPDFMECSLEEDLSYAMRNCSALSIPFKVLDLSDEYKKLVIDPFIEKYKEGETPNPDIFCNKNIKFGLFLKWALENGFSSVATGHYARVSKNSSYHLFSPEDTAKDQTYFLWTLNQDELSKIIFPLGKLTKKKVRELAASYNLPSANRKDSTGICFIGEVPIKQFLSNFIKLKKGDVIFNGKKLGEHDGTYIYVEGQRYRTNLIQKDLFVLKRDAKANTLVVGEKDDIEEYASDIIRFREKNLIQKVKEGETISVRLRHGGDKLSAELYCDKVKLNQKVLYSKGQSIVFYKDNECIGGAVMSN